MTGKREVHNEERKNDISTRSVSYDSNAGISGYGIGKDRGGHDRYQCSPDGFGQPGSGGGCVR